jgi:hypothetical protein
MKYKFSWEVLEEVYGRFPKALAASIVGILYRRKPSASQKDEVNQF